MDPKYFASEIEPKWQKAWQEADLYRVPDKSDRPKFYCLDFFPYPSGAGISVGHCRNYVPTDAISRFMRMRGYNVLHPMGWDAFGLPAENEAIQRGRHPKVTIAEYTANYKRQLNLVGCSYDWSREINSSHPDYYKWTQWFFLLLFERGLAYQGVYPANWCPSCLTVLANEEVHEGKCWRCDSPVEKRDLPQWFFKITDYAEQLLTELDTVDWPESIKQMQRNWIGRSEGCEFEMVCRTTGLPPHLGDQQMHEQDARTLLRVFTTRIDTVFGMTFCVIAPEHPLVQQLVSDAQRKAVMEYVAQAGRRSEQDRLSEEREITGVYLGAEAQNPFNNQWVPIYVADYVLMGYGTGGVMAVPGHDTRDLRFAQNYGLPIPVVIQGPDMSEEESLGYLGPGTMINSGDYSGIPSEEGKEKLAAELERRGIGQKKVHYRFRDWLISRQRYWGCPIPIVHCEKDGIVPVPKQQLPVLLPDVERYRPPGDGRSPLALIPEFVNTTCPRCGGPAQRETDTMGGFACSSWYFLRFPNPTLDTAAFDADLAKYWLPVDLYVGGAEHAVMHLLYARFWTKVMNDAGLVSFREPFAKLVNQGMVLAPDPQKPEEFTKMSKSKGNVVTPDEVVAQFGADTLRLAECFIAPFEMSTVWDQQAVRGCSRFLHKLYDWFQRSLTHYDPNWRQVLSSLDSGLDIRRPIHKLIKKVTEDIEEFKFNTAVAALMETFNAVSAWTAANLETGAPADLSSPLISEALEAFALLLAPLAPHLADEFWHALGKPGFVLQQAWPTYDPKIAKDDEITVVVQVNGKVRDKLLVPADIAQEELERLALASDKVQPFLNGSPPRKVITIPNRLVNIVV